MEIADVFAVNKADRDGADRLVAEIQAMLSLGRARGPRARHREDGGHRRRGHRRPAARDRGVPRAGRVLRPPGAEAAGAPAPASSRTSCATACMRRMRARVLTARGDGAHRGPHGRPRAGPLQRGRRGPGEDRAVKVLKIDHLGIAVPSLDAAVQAYEALGFAVESTHEVPTEKVRAAFLPVGESRLELLEPTDPSSVIAPLPGEAVRAASRVRAGGGHRGGARRSEVARRAAHRRGPAARSGRLPRGLPPSAGRGRRAAGAEGGGEVSLTNNRAGRHAGGRLIS